MLLIVTAISGSGRKQHLHEFEEYARAHKKKVKVYYVGDMLFEQAKKIGVPITAENVLNTNPSVLNSLRSAVFESILMTLPKDLKKNDAVILNVHSFFYWKKIFTRAYDRFYLGHFNADLFVTFIDDAPDIKFRLDAKEQWKPEKLTIQEILLWQNVEVEVTSSWADMYLKPFYALPVKQPISTLYKILFYPERESVYLCTPMSDLQNKKAQQRVDKFVEELNKYFTVIDPRTIERSLKSGKATFKVVKTGAKGNPIIFNQVVNRDLYWLVRQSKKIIAFFPKVVSSPGVINELREAHETNKNVWVIYPGKTSSPFLSYFSDRVFPNEKEFFKFLKKEYKPFKERLE